MTVVYLILQLAWTFFVIGAFTIGGGYAMLSLIQNQVVVVHPWITESAFTDIVAVSQMTPGPIGINSATYVGYDVLYGATGSHILGICGSLTATLSLMLPSFVIMLLIVKFYQKFKTSTLYSGTMAFLRPSVVGLIGAAAVILILKTTWTGMTPSVQVVTENFPDWKSWCLLGGAFVAGYWGKVNPIYIILAGAALGLLLY
ncbi:MAG: chromate transporter [Bacteroidales bacterium]|nr:chromate transporter [Bacteroidales bacterium]